MGGSRSRNAGGRTDAGVNRTTAYKAGVGTINEKGKKVTSSAAKFVNTDTKRNKPFKFSPVALQVGTKFLEDITGAPKKNRAFFINNYDRIAKNYKLPDQKKFNEMDLDKQQEIYTDMRQDFMRNNLNPFGETSNGGSSYTAPNKNNSILQTNTEATRQVASSGIVTSTGMVAPTTAEVSQVTATNAVEPSSSYSSDATLLANNKKGRRSTIMAKATGLGDSNLNTTKRTLGA